MEKKTIVSPAILCRETLDDFCARSFYFFFYFYSTQSVLSVHRFQNNFSPVCARRRCRKRDAPGTVLFSFVRLDFGSSVRKKRRANQNLRRSRTDQNTRNSSREFLSKGLNSVRSRVRSHHSQRDFSRHVSGARRSSITKSPVRFCNYQSREFNTLKN